MKISFAPMEGVTSYIYRSVHAAMFPGADEYYAPFIAPDKSGSFRLNRLKDILPENNLDITLVPQVLANDAGAFLSVARQLAELGYKRVNLNAGCPSGTVVAKHKGSGLLGDPEALDAFLDGIFSSCPIEISVKTRLGLISSSEFGRLMEIYEKYPLAELIIHARDRAGQYKSLPEPEAFAGALAESRLPLCYNGNIFTPADLDSLLKTAPGTERVMVGRGAVANPALPRMLRGGRPLARQDLIDFHDALLAATLETGLSDSFTAAHFKELWYYMIYLFPNSAREYKALNKASRLSDYRAAAASILRGCEFDGRAGFAG